MKFNSEKVRNIVYLKKDFVDIDGIDNYGRYVYDFSYWANIPRAIKNNSVIVKVSAYATNPIISTSMFENAKTSRQVIQGLKQYDAKLKSLTRSARANPLAVKYSDISANVSNEIAKKIKSDPENSGKYLGMRRQIMAIPTSKASGEELDASPNLNVSKVEKPANSDRSVRRAAIKSILTAGIDPSAVGEASFPINNYWASMQGTNRKFSTRTGFSIKRKKRSNSRWLTPTRRNMIQTRANDQVKTNTWAKHIRKSLRRSAYRDSKSISLAPTKTQVTTKLVSNNWAQITEEIRISSESIKGIQTIHFLIELFNSDGDIIDVKHRVVNQDAEVEEFLTPDYAPRVKSIATRMGMNTIYLRQVDRVGTEIWLYRKILNPSSPSVSGKYKLIRKIPASRKDRHRRVTDWVNNSSTCIYRAVAVGPRNRVSRSFKNYVTKPFRHSLINKQVVEELTHVSIFAQTEDNAVTIRVSNIPEGPAAIYVIADDLTRKPTTRRTYDSTHVVGTEPEDQTHVINSDTTDVTFKDLNVQHGHIYEYRCVMIYPSGSEVKSQITEVHEFFKRVAEEEKIVVDLTGLTVQVDDSANTSVSFDIEPSFTDTGMETIIGSLQSAGAEKNFISEVQADREKLNNLLAFLVQRQDSISGETETFGVLSTGQFVDDQTTRKYTGVSDIRTGRNYRYIVRVLLRSAETIFDTALSEEVDLETAKKFKKKISKFMNPSTLGNGTLPSTGQSLGRSQKSRFKPEDKFMQGRTGIEVAIDVEIPSFNPEIEGVTAQRVGTSKVLLYWTLSGDQDDIDHFIIMAELHGIKSTVGTCHNQSYQGRYYFFDREVSSEPGTVKYSIIPVLADYTYGNEVSAEEVTLESDMPSFTVET
jgi:hypothetical protein